jgi:hypothetical protein
MCDPKLYTLLQRAFFGKMTCWKSNLWTCELVNLQKYWINIKDPWICLTPFFFGLHSTYSFVNPCYGDQSWGSTLAWMHQLSLHVTHDQMEVLVTFCSQNPFLKKYQLFIGIITILFFKVHKTWISGYIYWILLSYDTLSIYIWATFWDSGL